MERKKKKTIIFNPPLQKMNSHLFQSSYLALLVILLPIHFPPSSLATDDEWFAACSQPFQCANFKEVRYPFWGGNRKEFCGHPRFQLDCRGEAPILTIESRQYRVLAINDSSPFLQVARDEFYGTNCPKYPHNATLDTNYFDYVADTEDLTLYYGCQSQSSRYSTYSASNSSAAPTQIACTVNGSTFVATDVAINSTCDTSVELRVNQTAAQSLTNSSNLRQVLEIGFGLQWEANNTRCSECVRTSGVCGSDSTSGSFVCYCVDGPDPVSCNATGPTGNENRSSSGERTIVVLVVTITAAVLVIIIFIYLITRRRMSLIGMLGLWKKERLDDQNVNVFLRHYGSLAPTQYRYSDIAKMTNSFKDKIGQGGYGTVYKGKLNDGRLVAVKVLSKTKGNGEEFINEVASISRTSHVNVVALLGFCFERKRRALVYEFMANGSLDRFIHNDESQTTNCHLEWRTMYQIVVGIARGLEYLHRGCSTRIVHFDIKPHNILLDEDFCPKISDFGLAKLCQRKQSIMSMLGTRGTIGYIAPELFSRAFGGVSHKSDVYSYGMLILEMSGATQKIEVAQTSETYFPHWIYEHLEHGKDQRLQRITSGEDEETARKMMLVGLWCIQTNPSDRPAMSKVLEMLEGRIQSLQIPPKPFLSSPARSAPCSQDSSMSSTTTNHAVEVPERRLQSMRIPPKPLSLPPSRPLQMS
ncbi:LEAF RUST 10 DISEASE-RESISTANCE LOCUS RECEPTOR-LIKE PROTEIN KINASE-like 2.1 isoform X8 [Diospyros lotus]|uniref:LEAF RUST 10 DISEASE-RESISTANCE LOCUS RECEPTOR-LIKE PROTEIN KINASE-like 2.1 isoform X6 n=1 Tax=Diospyros lotus TaxID=55363 RepID=UPI00224FD13E|nr:LEAF RUST 10 DISEASE-RESISTANCE LOCUS RECEPTOR-LIKE PROTEIN KINASE-like 2.1 isoform X6 [Diospyros lotus]XP_052204420.1 LEAF RUST 10 DISEASE-RESISTANCE LOCUS RECEPTOR-LIKE PROTEIN KINASE-like 2.1 isoform X7 [Diospyros lotus]XP_052204421.1 LEAF RUST 10 DISEASE-RESISTANCE LOCUS RECEPTOR-LIKE PROTEIN KINASE-like 2.1 isoform X8 [Diospyros lotus]